MIVWRGKGILTVLVFFLFFIASIFILTSETSYYGFVASFYVSGLFSWFFGNKWNSKMDSAFIDERTGQRLVVKNIHSLFWIPMQYWGIILPILGTIILAQSHLLFALGIAFILLAVFVFLYLYNREQLTSTAQHIEIKVNIDNSKEESVIETEEERVKRRLEKEDPSRFMPK